MRILSILLICLFPLLAVAEDSASSVEDNIKAMDTDHDGQVTVTEVRAYLQSQHGKDYKQALLDEMEIKAGLKSCGSPFSKSLY
jgi:Ca2+-binding EF-hand superfamily protein